MDLNFFKACCESDLENIKSILDEGIHMHINAKNENGLTGLHLSCMKNDIKVTQLLLNYGSNINSKDNDGITAFNRACIKGNYNLAKLLIQNGANVFLCNKNKQNCLHAACYSGNIELVKLLLKTNINSDDVDIFGNSPRQIAFLNGYFPIVALLMGCNKLKSCKICKKKCKKSNNSNYCSSECQIKGNKK